jgi:hypothetical protein
MLQICNSGPTLVNGLVCYTENGLNPLNSVSQAPKHRAEPPIAAPPRMSALSFREDSALPLEREVARASMVALSLWPRVYAHFETRSKCDRLCEARVQHVRPEPQSRIKRGRHAMGAAPAPDFRWLQLRVDAEGRAPTEINDVKDLPLEPAMGAERPVPEVERLKVDVEMAVDVVAGAEVHLRAPVTAKPPRKVSF